MVLDSLKFTCKKLSKEVQNNLVSELLPALKNFSIPHQLILQSFDILALLADIRSISNGEGNLAVSITQVSFLISKAIHNKGILLSDTWAKTINSAWIERSWSGMALS